MTPSGPPARWKNPYSRLPQARWLVQAAYAAFLVLVGIEFAHFHAQAVGDGPLTASRPPAVEAFLPISALVGLRRFVATGLWDDVHPAGLTILAAAALASLAARKAFCSWVCPVGTLSRALEWIGNRTLWRRRRAPAPGAPSGSGFAASNGLAPQGAPTRGGAASNGLAVPRWLDLGLSSVKYLLLGFFAWTIFWQMPVQALDAFMHSPYNAAADAKMLLFFRNLSPPAAAVLGVLALLSVAVKNSWCRYLCPYGALLGLASFLSPQRVRRDSDACNDCRACTRACPSQIQVHAKLSVLTPECTGCMSCVAACTVPDVLTVARKGKRGWSPWLVPAAGVGVMLALWLGARLTGHWDSQVPVAAFRMVYRMAPMLGH